MLLMGPADEFWTRGMWCAVAEYTLTPIWLSWHLEQGLPQSLVSTLSGVEHGMHNADPLCSMPTPAWVAARPRVLVSKHNH